MNKISVYVVLTVLAILSMWTYKECHYVAPDKIGLWMENGGKSGPKDFSVIYGIVWPDFKPSTKYYELPAKQILVDLPQAEYTSQDKTKWTVDPRYNLSIDRASAAQVCFRNSGYLASQNDDQFLTSIAEREVTPLIWASLKNIIGTTDDTILLNQHIMVAQRVANLVDSLARERGYIVKDFLPNAEPPSSITSVNEAKNLLIQAKYEAEAKTALIAVQAKTRIVEAETSAKIKLIEAETDAKALELRQKKLSKLQLQEWWIDKWDGKLPVYQTAASPHLFMGIDK